MSSEQQFPTYSPAIHARREKISRAWISRLRSGALIELRHGGPRNLFLVHDGEGDTLLYLNFARRMPDDLAVFAIEPRRLARVPLAHASIEDMAAFYIEEVRKKQPSGPYLLGGLCAGGVIAYEMASQLVRAGESVELVALLETATPKAPMKRGRIREQRLNRLKEAIANARKSNLGRSEARQDRRRRDLAKAGECPALGNPATRQTVDGERALSLAAPAAHARARVAQVRTGTQRA